MLPRILCIVGPTSSGKTSLGIRLAKELDGEIINADSRQIFKHIGIGTGKPEGKWQNIQGTRAYAVQGIAHHLMDVLEPTSSWTVAEWRDEALKKIGQIIARGHVPIVVGGTGLYIRALVDNPQYPAVAPQPGFREAMQGKGLDALVKMLLRLDPDAANAVDLKNPRRVLRALEVATFTGKPFTTQQSLGVPLVDAFQIAREWPREALYARIEAEVDVMVARGWVDEIKVALTSGLALDCPAMLSIGYRELAATLDGKISLKDAIIATKKGVRNYAKRQLTWFRRDTRVLWVGSEEEGSVAAKAWLTG